MTQRIAISTLALVLLAATATGQTPPRLTIEVGLPYADGPVGVIVHAFRPPNYDGIRFKRAAQIGRLDSALQKAQKIVAALQRGAAGKALDVRIVPGSAPTTIEITGKNGWRVTSWSKIVSDRTQERNRMQYHKPRLASGAVLSIAGTAQGADGAGLPGFVLVEAGPAQAIVPTMPGMSSEQIENELCIQLNSQGLPSFLPTPEQALGGLTLLSDTDGSGLVVTGLGGEDTLTVEVRDSGLEMDAMSVVDPQELPRHYGPERLDGDCDADGRVSIIDALLMSRIGVGLDLPPVAGSYEFDACNPEGVQVPDPGAIIDVIDALTVAQIAVSTPPAPVCPCDVPVEWLTPPPAPPGYRHVGRSVVVNFVLVESTYPLTRPTRPSDIRHLHTRTVVTGGVTCCDITVEHLFEPIP